MIDNAANRPLFYKSGTVPDVSGAIQDYYQYMVFTRVVKTVQNFQVVETPTAINFRGLIEPFTEKRLEMKPEGQRQWSWFEVTSDASLQLVPDEVITYQNVQYRVMSLKNMQLYGYMQYEIVQDYIGSGP